MIKVFVNDIPKIFNIDNTQLNITAIKALLIALENEGLAYKEKQKIVLDEYVFIKLWNIYEASLVFFDPNYNRKSDFKLYFINIIKSLYKEEKLNFFALFCPGYTTDGYKEKVGSTNKWKLKELLSCRSDSGDLIEKFNKNIKIESLNREQNNETEKRLAVEPNVTNCVKEDADREEVRFNELETVPIENLNLSNRTYNC